MITTMTTDRLILRDYNELDKDVYIILKSDKDTMYYLQHDGKMKTRLAYRLRKREWE